MHREHLLAELASLIENKEESQPKRWADALFGNVSPDSKEANLLALACALVMGNLDAAHHYYKTARQAGADDADLQNVAALVSQMTGTDLSPLAVETVWPAQETPAPPAPQERDSQGE